VEGLSFFVWNSPFFFYFFFEFEKPHPLESVFYGFRRASKTPVIPGSYKRCTPWLELETCCADLKPYIWNTYVWNSPCSNVRHKFTLINGYNNCDSHTHPRQHTQPVRNWSFKLDIIISRRQQREANIWTSMASPKTNTLCWLMKKWLCTKKLISSPKKSHLKV